MKTQVVIIHGGDTFETREQYLSFLKSYQIDFSRIAKSGWKNSLEERLGDNFEVISPKMPNKENARYIEWKIWFEKFFPLFNDEIIFIGHSLGGLFLVKYLSENSFPKKVKGIFLVGTPFDSADSEYTLVDFSLSNELNKLKEYNIYFYQSEDDPVVPAVDMEKYKKLLPMANFILFEDRGHFGQEEFPEIVETIKSLARGKE
ncbi:MAG: alpha/beta fold hydrolase [Patescibacteria group bacterium]|nr:alpha/beta fold hydrolase [Patescibacteria group bacterium]